MDSGVILSVDERLRRAPCRTCWAEEEVPVANDTH